MPRTLRTLPLSVVITVPPPREWLTFVKGIERVKSETVDAVALFTSGDAAKRWIESNPNLITARRVLAMSHKEETALAICDDEKPTPTSKGKRGHPPILDAQLVAGAIVKHLGNVSAVARQFKVDRSSVHELIAKHRTLQQLLRDARESMVDEAESSLRKAVESGEPWAVGFVLKTLGKGRGIDIDAMNAAAKRTVVVQGTQREAEE